MIKRILAIFLLTMIATTSQANPNHHMRHHGNGHYGRHTHTADWVIPAVIGSAVVYAIATRPAPVVVQNPPQVYPNPPIGYHYEQILDANCNCYRLALVPN